MTIWLPDLATYPGPRYRALALAIADAIARGDLRSGDRLPPQRELAWRIGVTVATVTRAYNLVRSQGLVDGQVGRGTYVRTQRPPPQTLEVTSDLPSEIIDLSINIPGPLDLSEAFARAATGMAFDSPADRRQLPDRPPAPFHEVADRYFAHAGLPEHRQAARDWLRLFRIDPPIDSIIITAGGQNAMQLAGSALLKPGDVLITEAITYPGIKPVADQIGARLHGVATDDEGINPEALAEALERTGARVLYLTPTIHNPTRAFASLDRRRAILDLVRRYDAMVIEDDVYACQTDTPLPPLAALDPERVIYFTSLSKSVLPGLRIGFAVAPPSMVQAMSNQLRTQCWMVTPIVVEIARRWIEDGTAAKAAEARRLDAHERFAAARDYLGSAIGNSDVPASHVWLTLPPPWTRTAFSTALENRGIRITVADYFAAPNVPVPEAVRLSLGGAGSLARLSHALGHVAETLASPVSFSSARV